MTEHDMSRYTNGKIYKLVNDVDDKIYVGSTCLPLHKRLYAHKQMAKRKPNIHVYAHLNEIDWDNVTIVLVEKYPCADLDELLRHERYWIEKLKPELNKVIPTRTKKERYEQNKNIVCEKQKEYYKEHKDKVIMYQKEYRKQNHAKILERQKQYNMEHKQTRLQYNRQRYENNKDILLGLQKQYYEQNKEKLIKYQKQPWMCDVCNCTIKMGSKAQHLKSKKHTDALSTSPEQALSS